MIVSSDYINATMKVGLNYQIAGQLVQNFGLLHFLLEVFIACCASAECIGRVLYRFNRGGSQSAHSCLAVLGFLLLM